ncbi:DUF177 domain-containing protein [Balneolaceae bacterium ANBcel3]|nr:DUF177 domain-containing protein [Balneolaceae bacterium ANBcel3]
MKLKEETEEYMVSFRINEIPKGISEEKLSMSAEELDILESGIKNVFLTLEFNKQDDHIRIQCHYRTEAEFVCDRSLDTYEAETTGSYEVVFQNRVIDEREDLGGALKSMDPSQNVIDITREIRDGVLLSIPVKKIHPRYINDGEISGYSASFGETEDDSTDPRWDSLKKLKRNN